MLQQAIEQLTETLKGHVLARFGHVVERVVLQPPPRLAMGDLATPLAIELAKALKKPPRQIAESLAEGLQLPSTVRSVSVEGAGYLNFRFDRGMFTSAYFRDVAAPPAPASERVIVEHTNINPNKAAHIGHLRNAVLGDTLVRCLKWLGYHVETQNYIDDTGVQVADVVVGFQHILKEGYDDVVRHIEDPNVRFDYFCWDLYSRVSKFYEEDPARRELQRKTLHEIEKHEGETARIGEKVAEAIVRWHLRTALRLGIEYDVLVKESDIIKLNFWSRAFELLKASGAVIHETEGKHAGCWVMKLSDSAEFAGLEEPDKILVRSNGTVTYVGKDIAYQLWKFGLIDRAFAYREFDRYEDGRLLWETTSGETDPDAPPFGHADRVYNVIDVRQAYLQKVVKEGLRLLGHDRQADRSVHFAYEMVALTPQTATVLGINVSPEDAAKPYVEMSGRKGYGVKADDLLDELERKAGEAVQRGERVEAGDGEVQFLARQIAVAALRYFMLKYGRNKVIAFDFAEALAFEGDSGPYLQYSTVRVENIFRKLAERGIEVSLEPAAVDTLTIGSDLPDDMWEIVRASAETSLVVSRAVETLEFATITRHAFELAQKFNSFYHKYPIANEADPAERQRRAICADIFRRTMRETLALLGIDVPAKM
jgi:arginyl-tRNA synthetase